MHYEQVSNKQQKLEKKLEKKDYNFKGHYFIYWIDFNKRKFEKDAYFNGATFQFFQNLSFAIFQKVFKMK